MIDLLLYYINYEILNTIGIISIILNSIVRLLYKSSYCPYISETNLIIGHPIVSRCLATVAEFSFYYQEAVWLNTDNSLRE